MSAASAADPSLIAPTAKPAYSTAWWGMVTLIATESMVFVVLLGSYFFLRASAPHWPLGAIKPPELRLSVPFSFVLWGSSIPIFYPNGPFAGVRKAACEPGWPSAQRWAWPSLRTPARTSRI